MEDKRSGLRKWFAPLNPKNTLLTFIPIWVVLAILGAIFTNIHVFLVAGGSFVVALYVNKWVADWILRRHLTGYADQFDKGDK